MSLVATDCVGIVALSYLFKEQMEITGGDAMGNGSMAVLLFYFWDLDEMDGGALF